jgi:hypothetical protein
MKGIMEITFIDYSGEHREPPTLAKNNLPSWYQEMPPYMNNIKSTKIVNGSRVTTATIKKCMPVFDTLTSGYLLNTWSDIIIENINNVISYRVTEPILTEHNIQQAPNHPAVNIQDDIIAKFLNNWGIKTPEGYSCLFIAPPHRENPISILTGIVDTDTYHHPVHLPFTLNNRNFTGVIPKGTPVAQIIPFNRIEWEARYESVNEEDNKKMLDKLYEHNFNAYKTNFWSSKRYS